MLFAWGNCANVFCFFACLFVCFFNTNVRTVLLRYNELLWPPIQELSMIHHNWKTCHFLLRAQSEGRIKIPNTERALQSSLSTCNSKNPKQNKAKVMRFSQLDCGKSRTIKKQPYLPRPTPWVCVHSSNNPRYWWFTTRLRRHYTAEIRTIRNTFFLNQVTNLSLFAKWYSLPGPCVVGGIGGRDGGGGIPPQEPSCTDISSMAMSAW